MNSQSDTPTVLNDGRSNFVEQASFALENYVLKSINYLERLVDADGIPYFNVFWTQPAEAAHDWPDYGDVMNRQIEGAIMLRHMTGREASTEKTWLSKTLSLIDPSDGQVHRPDIPPYSKAIVEDAALPLGALNAAALDGNDAARKAAIAMAEGHLRRLQSGDLKDQPLHEFSGFSIKSLMVTARMLHSEQALDAARILVERVIRSKAITPDNTFGPRTHTHGFLKTMVGITDYALTTGEPALYSRMDALYRHMKTFGTRFGFLPEVVNWRPSNMIACETCALMDYAGVGVTLANHGHAEYWGDMERLARNHLVESQVTDASWLISDNARMDSAQFTWHDIGQRILGAWAGWSSPNHILAYCETLNAHWGGPELRDKVRVLQNCCGGSGVHALFILWKNAARFENGKLTVNMHLDKLLPEAEIRCGQPYRGELYIRLNRACAVRVRIPEFTSAAQLIVQVNDAAMAIKRSVLANPSESQPGCDVFGNYVELGSFQAGDRIMVTYPLPVTTEEIAVGNPGFRQWHYRVTWKGDTVVKMDPLDNAPFDGELASSYSDFDKKEVKVFYGKEGPGLLYQRNHFLADQTPAASPLWKDDGSIDLWANIH
jgi:hypothetical protein